MNPLGLTAIIILAAVATGAYFYGMKKNRWVVGRLSKDIEEVLKPVSTNYVNIGGAIGYNLAYALPAPFTNAKGTITLSPRHSLLYLPFSFLIGVRDRFFINIFTKKKLRGEGHIVEAAYLRRAKIDGIDSMQRQDSRKDNKNFVLLWRGADLSTELDKLLQALPDAARIRHFCAYPETKTFFIYANPLKGQTKDNLEAIFKRLPGFLEKEKV
ncbi:MAG: hypothetical protein AB7T74_03185 [Clostridia bacterium]|jgi:hypothetical protein